MATKRKTKTRVSATTKSALNEMKKDRVRRAAEIAERRLERIRAVDNTFRANEQHPEKRIEARLSASSARAKLKAQQAIVDAIKMGAHSREITATVEEKRVTVNEDGSETEEYVKVTRPVDIHVSFEEPEDSRPLSGWNSSSKIFVGINGELFAEATKMQGFQLVNRELAEVIFDAMIGVGYHEIGHSVHSPNYDKLLELCKALFPDEFDHANWFQCLNALDDQRMETAMVMWSPNLARSLTSVVSLVIAPELEDRPDRFNLMHGRFYLPRAMQEEAEVAYELQHGPDKLRGVRDAIDAYLVAESYEEMAEALAAYVRLCMSDCDGDGPIGIGNPADGEVDGVDVIAQPVEAGSEEQIKADGQAIGNAKDSLEKGEFEAKAEPNKSSKQAENMAGEFQRNMQQESYGEMFAPESMMSPDDLQKAEILGRDIAQRLRTSASGNAHHWADRVRQGVVNSFAYKTRPNRAEMNFFRQERGSVSLGFDLDVVVLLDVSGSMAGWMDELSIVGHAIKAACDELGAHCTVGLYGDSYVVLYPSDATADGRQLEHQGGTYPKMAFEDVVNQRSHVRQEKTQLVIVMTDGQFHCSMAPYEDSNQHWIGVALGSGYQLISALQRNGFEETHTIEDPLEVATVLEGWLHDKVVAT